MAGIKEIAERAGVSMTTVSNVLNKKKNVGAETREQVLRIAQELGYTHKKQNGIDGKKRTIIVSFSDFDTLFYLDILHGVSDYVNKQGYHILICNGDDLAHYSDPDEVCGCIILSSMIRDEQVLAVADKGLPVITLDRELEHPMVKAMIVNNYEGERQLMQKLVDEGFKTFAYVTGQDTPDNKERYRAFRDVLRDNDISFHRNDLYEGDWKEKSGVQTARLIMLRDLMPEVLVCANDMMAIGAIRHFQENGIRVPDDISVCGFDDIIISRYLGLTTVSVPDYERGFLAGQALLNILDGSGDYETYRIGARVKWRRTAGHGKK
ncbi:LacI family DNA-binding transcriptional regulator [Butyrivibrio sp. FCS014]|uniref:LacI family DNA-binding transcriptional regulator n=1 Tax=Butyrivibrio sp. FCS014 TaxID=1408304 RepID=UPI000465729F|nr:LacI family DNA-binding transcriptional regulator [Butyrivibrio sp. FCS014]